MKRLFAIIVTTMITAMTFCSCVKIDNDIVNYADDVKNYQAELFMPKLEEITDYKDVEYFLRKDESFFPEYSIQLIVSYDEENFLIEKERLKTAYTYLDEPQKPDYDDTVYTIPLEEFSTAGFDFKVAEFDNTFYPKYFGMVGVSDERYQIAYLWVYALDLDYICKSDANKIKEMNEFIEYHFSLE